MGRLIQKRISEIELVGFSLAGEETSAAREAIPIDNMCLSHGHMDHTAEIAYYFSQRRFLGRLLLDIYRRQLNETVRTKQEAAARASLARR